MMRLLTLLCLFGASMAFGAGSMMKKYAAMKIMSSCVGEDTVMEWKMRMKAACDKCKGADLDQTMVDIKKMIDGLRERSSPFRMRPSQSMPQIMPVQYMVPVLRTKRSGVDLSPDGIEKLKEKMMAKVSNITCVLKELNFMDEDNQPNYNTFFEEVEKMPVDDRLKEDFMEAMDSCRDFASCMPVEKSNNPVKKELGTTMLFMKCMHMKKIMVCMQNDMRKYAPMMGFEGDPDEEESADLLGGISEFLLMEDMFGGRDM